MLNQHPVEWLEYVTKQFLCHLQGASEQAHQPHQGEHQVREVFKIKIKYI